MTRDSITGELECQLRPPRHLDAEDRRKWRMKQVAKIRGAKLREKHQAQRTPKELAVLEAINRMPCRRISMRMIVLAMNATERGLFWPNRTNIREAVYYAVRTLERKGELRTKLCERRGLQVLFVVRPPNRSEDHHDRAVR